MGLAKGGSNGMEITEGVMETNQGSKAHGLRWISGGLLAVGMTVSGFALALTTFKPGAPAKASEVNGNFTELSGRIDALEYKHSGPAISVDCASDADDLINKVATAPAGATLTVSGTCNGPVTIKRDRIKVVAKTAGVDGVASNVEGKAILAVKANLVTIEGLKVVATPGSEIASPTTESYGIGVFAGGAAKLVNVYVSGATKSILVGRSAAARLIDTTHIDNIFVYEAASGRIEGGSQGFDIYALRNGTVDIIRTKPGAAFKGIHAASGGYVRAYLSTDLTVNGKITLNDGAVALFKVPVNLNYTPASAGDYGLSVFGNSTVEFQAGGSTIRTEVSVDGASAMIADGVMFFDPADESLGGKLFVDAGSIVILQNDSMVGPVDLDENSTLILDNGGISGKTRVGPGSVLELTAAVLTGDLLAQANANIVLQDASTIAATRATNGACPNPPGLVGIQLKMGSVLVRRDSGSSISGYVEIDGISGMQDNTGSGYGGTVDASASTITNLQNLGASTNGIKTCK